MNNHRLCAAEIECMCNGRRCVRNIMYTKNHHMRMILLYFLAIHIIE